MSRSYELIRSKISAGEVGWRPGDTITLQEASDRLQVSRATLQTAFRKLREDEFLIGHSRYHVIAPVVPSAPRSTSASAAKSIAMILSEPLDDPYWSICIEGALALATRIGGCAMSLFQLAPISPAKAQLRAMQEYLSAQQFDGVLIVPPHYRQEEEPEHNRFYQELSQGQGRRVVLLDRGPSESGCPTILADNKEGAAQLVARLIDNPDPAQRCDPDMVFCLAEGEPTFAVTMGQRVEGALSRLKKENVIRNYQSTDAERRDQYRQLGIRVQAALAGSKDGRAGIIYLQDVLCVEMLMEAKNWQPQQSAAGSGRWFGPGTRISLASFDDANVLLRYLDIPSARNPGRLIGERALEYLIQWIETGRQPTEMLEKRIPIPVVSEPQSLMSAAAAMPAGRGE